MQQTLTHTTVLIRGGSQHLTSGPSLSQITLPCANFISDSRGQWPGSGSRANLFHGISREQVKGLKSHIRPEGSLTIAVKLLLPTSALGVWVQWEIKKRNPECIIKSAFPDTISAQEI